MAFTQNQTLTCIYQPTNGKVLITNSDGTGFNAIYSAGPNGSKVLGVILACSTDTSARDLQLGVNSGGTVAGGLVTGGTSFPLSTVTCAIGAGNAGGVPPANLMPAASALDSDAQPYILLLAGDVLYVQALTAVTSGRQISVSAPTIGDF